jgi:alkanesulfonate monooxygenase SsuD/methylene tetrahydromethanopterin reductase-like flavin-dependent oxidoreductase (luciferase family)
MIPRMWTEDPFTHEGRFYRIPPRSVIPKPVQKPHPPLWVACSQPDSFRAAGEMGLGALCFNLGGYAQMAERVGLYRTVMGKDGGGALQTPAASFGSKAIG